MWSGKSALELRVEKLMERVDQAGGDHVRLVPVLEEYLRLAEAYEDDLEGFFFDTGAWYETLADSYLAVGRVDDAVRLIGGATRRGHSEGAAVRCAGGVGGVLARAAVPCGDCPLAWAGGAAG